MTYNLCTLWSTCSPTGHNVEQEFIWNGLEQSRKKHFFQVLNSISYPLVLTALQPRVGVSQIHFQHICHLGNSVKLFKHEGGSSWVLSHHNCVRKLGSEFGAQKFCWNTAGDRGGRSGTTAVWNVSHVMGQVLLKLPLQPVEKSVKLHECIAVESLVLAWIC